MRALLLPLSTYEHINTQSFAIKTVLRVCFYLAEQIFPLLILECFLDSSVSSFPKIQGWCQTCLEENQSLNRSSFPKL